MGEMLSELIGFEWHEILGNTKCDPRSNTDRWDKWLMLVSSDGKDWDLDPRPTNWTELGWAVSVKRPGSPLKETNDSKKYTSIRWDSSGCTDSKTTVTPSHQGPLPPPLELGCPCPQASLPTINQL